MSLREQPLLPALDVFGMGWVIKRLSQGAAAEKLPKTQRPNILQLNTEGLTADKISVIEQLAYKNKPSSSSDRRPTAQLQTQLVIPYFSPAGSVLSRNHGLATFVHELL